jgi:hypothetical protein
VLAAVLQPDLEQLVHELLADLGPPGDLLEFLVQRLIAAPPINVCVNIRKEECEKSRQVRLQNVLPRAVEFIRCSRRSGHAGEHRERKPAQQA